MSNDYFDSADFTAPTANSRARASQIVAIAAAVEQGFDRLPSASSIGKYVADTGAADAYVVTLSPVPTAYAAGMTIRFKATNANTGTCTLNVNSLGAKTIKKRGATDNLAANDIVANQIVEVTYDGTYFQLVSMASTANDDVQDAAGYASAAAASASAASASEIDAEAAAAQVNSVLYKWCGTAGGTANALTLTPAAALTSYGDGNRLTFLASADNTGAATVNVSALGAKNIKRSNGDALIVGDILSGSMYTIVYDGTNFRLSEGDRDLSAATSPDRFSGTGAQTNFTLTNDPGTENAIDVFVSGVYQQKNTFSLSGTTLTFSVAPASGTNNIEVMYRANIEAQNVPSDASVTTAKLADSAVTGAKIADGTITAGKLAAGISHTTPVSTKTATYDLLAADLGTEIKFTTSATTLNLLAAATAGNGAIVVVSNAAASGDVTIEPNGAETIDDLANRVLRPGNRVTLRSDGTEWETIGGKYTFTSSEISPAISSVGSAAHGLGMKPTSWGAVFKCTSADNNWAVDDEVDYNSVQWTYGSALGANTTTVYATMNQIYTGAPGNRTTGVGFSMTYSKWKLILSAEVDYG